MSSSVCHAPLPARMEAFTTRLCLRAVDQYEKLLQAHFSKVSRETIRKTLTSPSRLPRERNNASSCARRAKIWQRSTSLGNAKSPPADAAAAQEAELDSSVLAEARVRSSKFPSNLIGKSSDDLSLKYLALNALDLTAPASDVLLKNRLKSWFQLSGHPDGFSPAGPGTVWKRLLGGPENSKEREVYEALCRDESLQDCIPRYYRQVQYKGESFIELQDLLFGFTDPCVMDIKLGTRTFLESEVSKTAARCDLYRKMIAVDENAPTAEEHERQAVTKLRYMQFREQQSSTCSHGFRIEAMKLSGEPPITDLKKVKSHEEVFNTLKLFINDSNTRQNLVKKLENLRSKVENCEYFQTHEIIGSSIFIIYDSKKVGAWLIDFAKTCEAPDGKRLTHRTSWEQGNHEEGFLLGIDNLISVIKEVDNSQCSNGWQK